MGLNLFLVLGGFNSSTLLRLLIIWQSLLPGGCYKMNCQVQDAVASVIYLRLKALAYHIRSITYSNCRFGICDCISLLRDGILQKRPVWDC